MVASARESARVVASSGAVAVIDWRGSRLARESEGRAAGTERVAKGGGEGAGEGGGERAGEGGGGWHGGGGRWPRLHTREGDGSGFKRARSRDPSPQRKRIVTKLGASVPQKEGES